MARFQQDNLVAYGGETDATDLGRWWVDDQGRLLPYDQIARCLTDARVAYRHYGMVAVQLEPRTATIKWDVARVNADSIRGAAAILARRSPDTVITLQFFWGGWRRESGYTLATAFERMTKLAEFRDVEPFTGSALIPRPIAAAEREEGAMIARAFMNWDRSRGDLAHPEFMRMMPFFLTFRADRHETSLYFHHVGAASAGVGVWGQAWANDAPGRICHRSQPDFEFDDRVCATYYDVLETGEPRLEHVRAVIHRENQDPAWLSYRRLVVRGRDRMGAPTVVSLCDLSNDLAVPFMAS